MNTSFKKEFQVRMNDVDRFDRLKVSTMLLYIQQISGLHSDSFSLTYDALAQKGIFWAVIRHKVQVTRLPLKDEIITLETWPMPTTRVAYPRATVAYDAEGKELFRSTCLWILMDLKERSMLLPNNSGVLVEGTIRGDELSSPKSLMPKDLEQQIDRKVVFSDLDLNGHMNNARYLDWVQDLLPADYHRDHPVRELTVCYINEALEAQTLQQHWSLDDQGLLQVDIHRQKDTDAEDHDRIFAAKVQYA